MFTFTLGHCPLCHVVTLLNTTSIKDLGVTFDSLLSVNKHVDTISKGA